MSTNKITVEGHLPKDFQIQYGQDGRARLSISVSDNKSHKDEQTGQWVNDSPTIWFDATIWGAEAEAFAEKAVKGARVSITGRLILREYTTGQGEQRTAHTIEFPAVRIDPPKQQQGYTGHQRDDGSWTPNRQSSFNSATGRGGFGQQGGDDPWKQQGGTQTGGFGTDEIPF